MHEPATTLTDFALALECLAFAVVLARLGGASEGRRDWVLFYGAASMAALLGGVDHGLGLDSSSLAGGIVWRVVLLAVGLSALAGWRIGSNLALPGSAAGAVRLLALVLFAAYAVVVTVVDPSFRWAVIHYLPAMVFTLACLVVAARSRSSRRLAIGAVGLVIGLAAAALQQQRIGIHPVHFDHNALYHIIQMAALALLFVAALEDSGA